MKKAQGLSITTIVVAAIALLILIVLVAIFTGNIGSWNRDIANCQLKGGTCVAEDTCTLPSFEYGQKTTCEGETPVCCINPNSLANSSNN